MVNRTKISKEIRRRAGGVSKTGNGTKVEDLKPKDWEQIPGTGGSPHNPPRYRLTAKAKKRQQTQFKLKQAAKREKVTAPAVKALRESAGALGPGAPWAKLTKARRDTKKVTPATVTAPSKAERERTRKAGSLDVGHPRTAVKRESLGPPLGYKGARAEAAKKVDTAVAKSKMEGVDPTKHKELQETIRRADRIAKEKLAEGKRKREAGEYEKLTFDRSAGGSPKRKTRKKYSAGGLLNHNGNLVVSEYYD